MSTKVKECKRFLWAIFVTVFLAIGGEAFAQGNDFPGGFWASSPSWNPIPTLTPVPGVDWSNGQAAGPYYLTNRRGDRMHIEFVLDWWALGPLQTVIRTTGDEEMHWTDGEGDGGVWRGWCIRCGFDFIATTDNVVVWVEYAGSRQFGLHLENFQVIANQQEIIKKERKDRAAARATEADNTKDFLTITTLPPACWASPFVLCPVVSGVIVYLDRAAKGLRQIAIDPWDWQYGVPYEPVYHDPSEWGAQWLNVDPSGDGQWPTYTNNFLWNMMVADAQMEAVYVSANRASTCWQVFQATQNPADDCYGWQAERANWFLNNSASYLYGGGYWLWRLGQVMSDQWNIPLDGGDWASAHIQDAANSLMATFSELYQ